MFYHYIKKTFSWNEKTSLRLNGRADINSKSETKTFPSSYPCVHGFAGDNINNVLNENWRDLDKEVGPGLAEAIGEVFQLVLKNICDVVPYDVVFNLN